MFMKTDHGRTGKHVCLNVNSWSKFSYNGATSDKRKSIICKRIKSELNLNTSKLSESNPVVTKQIMRLNVLQIVCSLDENEKKVNLSQICGFCGQSSLFYHPISQNWHLLSIAFSILDLKIPRSLYLQMLHKDGQMEEKNTLCPLFNETSVFLPWYF